MHDQPAGSAAWQPVLFAGLSVLTTATVFAQAVIAGGFVSQDGRESWITVHGIVADVAWIAALVTAVVGAVTLRRSHPKMVAAAAICSCSHWRRPESAI
ncbi:hypothetical protein FOS14_09835 [Skermania sp. ID1734]|uniref:hypothetical protein n=1 Tax=Skermania sp. ID1734 TaxID=2597516 RepID=UPI00117C11CB|nr:hypothetical protein [Skermania sp. ID1734]TSE00103.1 hypothetical protein FOS14_09835 [Skermania sp. ID1734]